LDTEGSFSGDKIAGAEVGHHIVVPKLRMRGGALLPLLFSTSRALCLGKEATLYISPYSSSFHQILYILPRQVLQRIGKSNLRQVDIF